MLAKELQNCCILNAALNCKKYNVSNRKTDENKTVEQNYPLPKRQNRGGGDERAIYPQKKKIKTKVITFYKNVSSICFHISVIFC